jgi:YD repeat-containing protein
MKQQNSLAKICSLAIVLFSGTALGAALMPPPIEFKDRHGADLMGAHVSITQQDISIGGSMGLSHSVGTHTSNFANYNDETKTRFAPEGFLERYRGFVDEEVYSDCDNCVQKYRMNVTDGLTSSSFETTKNHATFTPSGDSRHQLLFVNNPSNPSVYHQSIINFNQAIGGFTGFIWIKPDGTLVYYPVQSATATRAFMSHIQQPDGKVIAVSTERIWSFNSVTDVSTNTGFQLKYIYQYSSKTTSSPGSGLPGAQAIEWSIYTPKYILGINNASLRCPSQHNVGVYPTMINNEGQSKNTLIANACSGWSAGDNWPVVTYTWPDYMPLSMYQNTAAFKVTDPMGIETEYVHTPWTTKTSDGRKYPQAWYDTTPRLTQIKKAGKVVMNYAYLTPDEPIYFSYGAGIIFMDPGRAARIRTSWIGNDIITYQTNIPVGSSGSQTGIAHGSAGYQSIGTVSYEKSGSIKMHAWDKSAIFHSSQIGRLTSVNYILGGTKISFEYHNHAEGSAQSHNVTKKTENGLSTTAGGYQACTPFNYKICNQPTWITDPNGNTTDYEYYPESGLPKTITLPANADGIRAQTKYYYTAKSAVYLQSPGASTPQLSPLPIYLLTKEIKCQKSAPTATGCTLPNDEIISEYDYGPSQAGVANNLFLRGMSVTALNSQGARETRRTCYAYDKYGNRIGETKPKANLTSCP